MPQPGVSPSFASREGSEKPPWTRSARYQAWARAAPGSWISIPGPGVVGLSGIHRRKRLCDCQAALRRTQVDTDDRKSPSAYSPFTRITVTELPGNVWRMADSPTSMPSVTWATLEGLASEFSSVGLSEVSRARPGKSRCSHRHFGDSSWDHAGAAARLRLIRFAPEEGIVAGMFALRRGATNLHRNAIRFHLH